MDGDTESFPNGSVVNHSIAHRSVVNHSIAHRSVVNHSLSYGSGDSNPDTNPF